MQGAVRFALFVAIIGLVAAGVYANNLRATVTQQQTSIAALMKDRDAAKTQAELSRKQIADNAAVAKDAEAKIADLQTQLDAAKKAPPARRR